MPDLQSESPVYKIGNLITGRYRVLETIESGGMGRLYRVADEAKAGQILALKAVRLNVSGAELPTHLEHFRREFKLLSKLRHPNLVSVYEYGVIEKREFYFTMEWIDGQSLDRQSPGIELAQSIPIIIQVCRALNYLHSRGIAHGDIKPSNILLSGEQAKIVDFGVSMEIRKPGAIASYYTPIYSSPEMRDRLYIDHRTDLYSLGAVWYSMIVGQPPLFQRGEERLIRLELEDLFFVRAEASPEIAALIARMMSASPDGRPSNANEVILEINRITHSAYELETSETARSYALRSNFIGRETEFNVLQEAWNNNESALILVEGASGIGKSRLLEEFAIKAQLEGALVLSGRCVESGASSFHPWREILRLALRYLEAKKRDSLLPIVPILAELLPELRRREYFQRLPPLIDIDPKTARQRIVDAILRALRLVAQIQPILLLIEDAHWADESTLAVLSALGRVQAR